MAANAINTELILAGPPALLDFTQRILPALFVGQPADQLNVRHMEVVSVSFNKDKTFVTVNLSGGIAPDQWRLTGLVFVCTSSIPIEYDDDIARAAVRTVFDGLENYQNFGVQINKNGTITDIDFICDSIIPPSSGFLNILQINDADGLNNTSDTANTLLRTGYASRQVDGKIYRLWNGFAFSSAGVVSLGGKALHLDPVRIAENKRVVKIAGNVKSLDTENVYHIRSNVVQDMLIRSDVDVQNMSDSLISVSDPTGVTIRTPENVARVLRNNRVDLSEGHKISPNEIPADREEFYGWFYGLISRGENLIIRPRNAAANSSVLILAPRNMFSRAICASVHYPATSTGLRSRLLIHPAARCFQAVSGSAMFEFSVRLSNERATVMVFPSREVQQYLDVNPAQPKTAPEVVSFIRENYNSQVVGTRDPLFDRLMRVLPTPDRQTLDNIMEVYCNNLDAMSTIVRRFPSLKSSVGTFLPESVDTYFQENEDGDEENDVFVDVKISHQCFLFLQLVGANFPVNAGHRFIDFIPNDEGAVTFAQRGHEGRRSALKSVEFAVKSAVNDVMARTGARRENVAVNSVRVFCAPQIAA